MPEQDKVARPKAQSIIVLGFSRNTRHFLFKLGIKTVDSLSKLDRDYLACNGANEEILAEVQSYLGKPDLKASSEIEDLTGPKETSAAIEDDLPLNDIPVILENEPRESEEDGKLALLSVAVIGGQTQPEITDSPKPLELRHMPLGRFLQDLGLEETGLLDDEGALSKTIDALMDPANNNIALHSSDKRMLKAIAHSAGIRYEDALSKQSELAIFFPQPVTNLPLPKHASNILARQHIRTVGDLCAFGESCLQEARGAGAWTVNSVKGALEGIDARLVGLFETATGEAFESVEPNSTPEEELDFSNIAPDLLNLPFDTSTLSVRAQHSLKHGRIETVGEVLTMGEGGLLRLRNTGLVTVQEILHHANYQARVYLKANDNSAEDAEDIPIDNEGDLAEPAQDEQETVESRPSNVRISLIDVSEFALIPPSNMATLLESFSNSEIQTMIEDSALCDILRHNPWGLTQEEMLASANLLDSSITINELTVIASRLRDAQRARFNDGFFYLIEPSIKEVVDERVKNANWRSMVYGRLLGKTLESIGENNGVTRERVRQITSKAMDADLLDGTRAGHYLDLMRRYQLGERETRFGLGATIEEWEAASLVKKIACKNDLLPAPAEALVEDRRIPLRVRLALEKEIHHGFVKIDGEYVPQKRLDLMLFALKRYGSKSSLGDEEFTDLYRSMLQEHELQDEPGLQLSERYMSNFRLQKCVLSGYWTRVRYYDFDKHDVRKLIDSLGFEDYEGKEVSTRLFLATKPELLRDFEIDDAYELHSLLRSYARDAEKTGESLPYSMTRRMPIIRIGETDRETQVVELAQELSPISVDDFAAAYEEEYGVEQASVKGDFLKFINHYIANSTISMDLEPFTEIERQRMAELFPGDFYRLSRFEATYRREFPKAGTGRLNALSIRSLGFKIYSACILRDTWKTQNAFFDSLVLGNEFFQESSVTADVMTARPFRSYFDSLVRERRLLPYEDDTWITEKGLRELGITDEMMIDFASKAAEHCDAHGRRYCTARSLKNEDFDHEIFTFELDETFYTTLICTKDTRFTAISCGGKKIACLDDARPAVAAFLESQIDEDESLAAEDLIERAQEDYGITVRRDKVLSAPGRTDLYYSPLTDMIYKDRQTFIKEVE